MNSKLITFILDQLSINTIDNKYYKKISELIDGSSTKLIICSSINDNNIKEEVRKTFKDNKGNPKTLNKNTEKYYYYFSDLINLTEIMEMNLPENKLFKLFNYNDKYVKLLGDKPSELKLESIKKEIGDKIDKTFNNNNNIDYKYILANIQNFIYKDINYEDCDYIFQQIPLKYFKLILHDNDFQIDYQFPYIRVMTEDCLSENEIDNYFQKEEYKLPDKKEIKGIFFERAVKNNIKKIDFLPDKINIILKAKSILGFDEIEINYNSDKNNNKLNDEKDIKTEVKNINEKTKKKIENKNLNKKRYRQGKDKSDNSEGNIKDEIIEGNSKEKGKEKRKGKGKGKKGKDKDKEKGKQKENQLKLKEIGDKNQILMNFKDYGILIEQKNPNGPILDLGYLFGKSDEKIFVGFQMKNFGKDTDLKEEDKTKYMKNNILSSLLNFTNKIKTYYEIIIKEFHAIFVIYYNKQNNCEYSNKLTKYCKMNDIKYIFYDPVLKTFYDEKERDIDKLILDDKSNLNSNSQLNPFRIFKNMNLSYKTETIVKYVKEINNYLLYLSNIFNKKDESKNKFKINLKKKFLIR